MCSAISTTVRAKFGSSRPGEASSSFPFSDSTSSLWQRPAGHPPRWVASRAHARPPPAAAEDDRGLPGRRHRLEGLRGRVAAGLHAARDRVAVRRRRAADDRHRAAVDPHPPRGRRVARALPLRRRGARAPGRARTSLDRLPARRHDALRDPARRVRRAALAPRARPGGRDRLPHRRARPVDVHEPRARLRAPARRRARPRVRDLLGQQRAADDRAHRLARRLRGPAGARPAARQLRRLDRRAARPVALDGASSAAAPRRRRPPETPLAHAAAALRAADRPGRRVRLRAQPRRPLVPVPPLRRRDRRRLLDRDQARRRHRLRRARLPVQLAAARLLDRGRQRGEPLLRVRRHVLPARHRLGRRRPAAARALVHETAGGARLLRRAQGAAVARTRLVALRPVRDLRRDRRTCRGDDAQLPRGCRRSGGQRGAAGRADAGARDRRRRPRAGWRLRRDARRDAPADAQPVRDRLRMAPHRPARARARWPVGRGRAAAAHGRRRRLHQPRRARPAAARRARPHRLLPPRGACAHPHARHAPAPPPPARPARAPPDARRTAGDAPA